MTDITTAQGRQSGRPVDLDQFKFLAEDFLYDFITPQNVTELYFTVTVTGGKSYTFTNLQTPQQIPFSQNFWVYGITAGILQNYQVFPPTINHARTAINYWNDLEAMYLGNWKLRYGNTQDWQGTLKEIINYNTFAVISPYSSATGDMIYHSHGSIYGRAQGFRKFKNPFVLTPKFNFSVEVQWAAIPTFATNIFSLGIIFTGKKIRLAQ